MSGKAREQRDKGEVNFVSVCEDLRSVTGVVSPKKRTVTKGIDIVKKSWEKLKEQHAEFCRHLKVSITSSESMEYIAQMGKLGREVIDASMELIGGDEEVEDKRALQELTEEFSQLSMDIEMKLVTLASLANADLSGEKHGQAMNTLDMTGTMLRLYMECNGRVMRYMEGEDRKKQLDTAQKFYKSSGGEVEKCRIAIIGKTPIKIEPKANARAAVQPVDNAGTATHGIAKQPVKIKAMEPPRWDGRYRTFTRFKLLWDENIASRVADSAQHMMLCEALPKHILDNISTMSNSADDIWKYLDEKYGRSDVVAREIMAELMSLDSRKLGKQFISKFCTMMMDTLACLTAIGEQDWLVSNSRVAEMEDKLPKDEKLVWAEKMHTMAGVSKFEKFKNFLHSRKQVMDSIDTMGCRLSSQSSQGGDKCGYCNKPNHTEDNCFTKQRDQGSTSSTDVGKSFPRGRGGCAICGDVGHWQNECPDRFSEKDKRSGGGKGGNNNSNRGRGKTGKGDSGAVASSGEVGSNTLRALDCQRCKASSKLYSCAGCKKTSNINHCLAHCSSFMVLGVDDRVSIVKTSKSCAICLHPSHTSSA